MSAQQDELFRKAVYLIRNGPPRKGISNQIKLNFYSLYKQATEGDCQGTQPWAYQITERAKWDAWNTLRGMTCEEAQKRYISMVANGDPLWEQNEVFQG